MNPLRHERVTNLARRSREVLLLSALTGALTGLAVAGFEWVAGRQGLERLYRLPVPAQVAAPALGLLLAALALHWLASDHSPSTSDEYIRNFHDPSLPLDLRPVLGRVVASIATLGSGGALGFEGPSIYIGSAIGTGLQARFRRLFALTDVKVLMVAGAAAGVSAIFKTPATGAIFALEVPFRDDTAKRMLLPALVGSVTGYLVYVAIYGTEPLFPVGGSPPFGTRELAGAALVGVLAGLGARGFAALTAWGKGLSSACRPSLRIAGAGGTLAVLLVSSRLLYGESLTLGAGYNVIEWISTGDRAWWALAALLVLRTAATTATVAGGGAGGLFVPLVVGGALVGALCSTGLAEPSQTLFPVIGVAAFLGAGYRTPIAAVMFVAESTGRPGFIVPGLIATVVSQLMMGSSSVSRYQAGARVGHLEHRFELPLSVATQTKVLTAPSDATVDELLTETFVTSRHTTVPIVDHGIYVGIVTLDDLRTVDREERRVTLARALVHDDAPRALPTWSVEQAIRAMSDAGRDLLPVVDIDGTFVGIVTTTDLLRLDEILAATDADGVPGVGDAT
jgi:CIC family chloride channel protein